MENSVMQKYVDFICSEISDSYNIILYKPETYKGKEVYYIPKIGTMVYDTVKVEIIAKYTRSAKLRITFDKYTNESIYYMSRHKGPDVIFNEIKAKITKIVNDTYKEDNRKYYILNRYELKEKELADSLKNVSLLGGSSIKYDSSFGLKLKKDNND